MAEDPTPLEDTRQMVVFDDSKDIIENFALNGVDFMEFTKLLMELQAEGIYNGYQQEKQNTRVSGGGKVKGGANEEQKKQYIASIKTYLDDLKTVVLNQPKDKLLSPPAIAGIEQRCGYIETDLQKIRDLFKADEVADVPSITAVNILDAAMASIRNTARSTVDVTESQISEKQQERNRLLKRGTAILEGARAFGNRATWGIAIGTGAALYYIGTMSVCAAVPIFGANAAINTCYAYYSAVTAAAGGVARIAYEKYSADLKRGEEQKEKAYGINPNDLSSKDDNIHTIILNDIASSTKANKDAFDNLNKLIGESAAKTLALKSEKAAADASLLGVGVKGASAAAAAIAATAAAAATAGASIPATAAMLAAAGGTSVVTTAAGAVDADNKSAASIAKATDLPWTAPPPIAAEVGKSMESISSGVQGMLGAAATDASKMAVFNELQARIKQHYMVVNKLETTLTTKQLSPESQAMAKQIQSQIPALKESLKKMSDKSVTQAEGKASISAFAWEADFNNISLILDPMVESVNKMLPPPPAPVAIAVTCPLPQNLPASPQQGGAQISEDDQFAINIMLIRGVNPDILNMVKQKMLTPPTSLGGNLKRRHIINRAHPLSLPTRRARRSSSSSKKRYTHRQPA